MSRGEGSRVQSLSHPGRKMGHAVLEPARWYRSTVGHVSCTSAGRQSQTEPQPRSRAMHALLKSALVGTVALVLAGSSTASAQVGLTSNVATVALTATKAATLTVSTNVATATLANITDNSTANQFTPVSVTT